MITTKCLCFPLFSTHNEVCVALFYAVGFYSSVWLYLNGHLPVIFKGAITFFTFLLHSFLKHSNDLQKKTYQILHYSHRRPRKISVSSKIMHTNMDTQTRFRTVCLCHEQRVYIFY